MVEYVILSLFLLYIILSYPINFYCMRKQICGYWENECRPMDNDDLFLRGLSLFFSPIGVFFVTLMFIAKLTLTNKINER